MIVTLIRHGKTEGNLKKQYIGVTDQPLCSIGIEEIENKKRNNEYLPCDIAFSSPLLRCIETGKIIYPKMKLNIIDKLQECDFGEFECKSYDELKENKAYIQWLESGGEIAFPKGEAKVDFQKRCVCGFAKAIEIAKKEGAKTIAIVCHGGSIMSIMNEFSCPHKPFYDWQIKNGEHIEITLDENIIGGKYACLY